MQFYRCKCGNSKSWTTMGVPACSRCSECGSDLAQGPDSHSDPAPHKLVTRYNQTTGAPYRVCLDCLLREDEIPADQLPPSPLEAQS